TAAGSAGVASAGNLSRKCTHATGGARARHRTLVPAGPTAACAKLPALPANTGPSMRSILITGAASGIGAGIALELGRAGHHIIVSDLNPDAAGEVARQIREAGGSAEAVALDVTSDESVAARSEEHTSELQSREK